MNEGSKKFDLKEVADALSEIMEKVKITAFPKFSALDNDRLLVVYSISNRAYRNSEIPELLTKEELSATLRAGKMNIREIDVYLAEKKSVFELPKMVTDNPQGNFETMLNLVYGKDGRSYIRHGDEDIQITDFCFNALCPKFGCTEFADQTMTSEEQDQLLSDCVFYGCPVATVYAALSGYGHLRDRLRQHEDAMANRVLPLPELQREEER